MMHTHTNGNDLKHHDKETKVPAQILHPKKLLNSISNSLTVNNHSECQGSLPTNKRRRQAIWHPMHALVSRMRNLEASKKSSDSNNVHHLSPIDHCGRFKIGHPLSCNANIVDDPTDSDQAMFLTNSHGNGTLNQHFPKKGPASLTDTLNSDSQSVPQNSNRPNAIFLESDILRCSFPEDTPVIIRINVSGVKFLVLNSTLQRDPFIYSKFLEDAVWLPEEREYFFERDPTVFRFVHNYLRRGEVHLPCGMCGPLLEKELDDWGLPLGLDVQRCCLGPMMDTKFKLESLQRFEEKLESDYIKPTNWIKSPAWQAFRAKIWRIIDFTPKLSFVNPTARRSFDWSMLTTPYALFSSERETSANSSTISSTNPSKPIRTEPPSMSTLFENNSDTKNGERSRTTSVTSSSRCEWWIRRARRVYAVYETLTVTAAVIVFMLSSCKAFRVPISTHITQSNNLGNLSLFDSRRTNLTQITLPTTSLLAMDIFFSIVITIDLLIRMVFCPDIRYWLCTIYTMIDILSLIPFYIQLILYEMIQMGVANHQGEFSVVLIKMENYLAFLKVFIVLRLFRVLRRHRGTRVLLYTIRTTLSDLTIIIILILESALFFGSAMYFSDDTVEDIPKGCWWALITMTTVGYGDVVPSHTFGYIVAMICVLTGTLLMAYTVPILVNHFLLYYAHADQLYMLKQLHRAAQSKASKRTMSKVAQKALASAKGLMSVTLTKTKSIPVPKEDLDIAKEQELKKD